MGGYANGGDAIANQTSLHPATRLGGSNGPYSLTTGEISMIAFTITLFAGLLIGLFCSRKLKIRRRIDMEYKARQQEDGAGDGTIDATKGLKGGDDVELQDRRATGVHTAAQPSSSDSSRVTNTGGGRSLAEVLDSGKMSKPPLWNYIIWTNPNGDVHPEAHTYWQPRPVKQCKSTITVTVTCYITCLPVLCLAFLLTACSSSVHSDNNPKRAYF
jgi:hypothetical protein